MTTKKYKQKLMKHQICVCARIISCAAFLVLALIGVSSLVRAMSLESVANKNGIPSVWQAASLGHPESITVPITYWDQRQDDCNNQNRQFEWTICGYWTAGALQGVVQDRLGSDGLPIPSFVSSSDAWAANHDIFTANVTGHNPVQTTDNFYRWFHNTNVSKQYDRKITFKRVNESNTYYYGGDNIFPLDNVDYSSSDSASNKNGDDGKKHNFHFTAHLQIPVKISTDGSESFEFSGDDDVWVFLNGQLVLDIGGLHEALNGGFTINPDGSVTSYVQNVNDVSGRANALPTPTKNDPEGWYAQQLSEYNRSTYADKTVTYNLGLKAGDVVNLDFFYAERSTTASNTHITIKNMNWPISADSDVQGKVIGVIEGGTSNLVEFQSNVKNRDPINPLKLDKFASYISDEYTDAEGNKAKIPGGYLPLDVKTLYYTATPDDADSWQPVAITPPLNSTDGFSLEHPITLNPAGEDGDTVYFRYFAETSPYSGDLTNIVAYYTDLNGVAGVTYDNTTIPYTGATPEQPKPTYTVTVHYEIEGENENNVTPPEDHRETLESGKPYNVTTPTLDGFTPDQEVVSGVVTDHDVEVTVKYKKTPEQPKPKYLVEIEYIKTDTNTEAFPKYSEEHEEGSNFTIYPEELEGYTKDRTEVVITVPNGPVHEIVYYTPKTTPVTPVDPTPVDPNPVTPTPDPNPTPNPVTPEPDQPSDPLPIIPIIPSDNGDELIFIAPLGEVAYVPNTGVVSDFVAPIFEQYFAEVILSQGFVLAALLIFAASFATFFSLRKHLHHTVPARAAASAKKMPKDIANSKTARTMQKNARKAAKTVANSKSTKTVKTTTSSKSTKTAKTSAKPKTTKTAKTSAKTKK